MSDTPNTRSCLPLIVFAVLQIAVGGIVLFLLRGEPDPELPAPLFKPEQIYRIRRWLGYLPLLCGICAVICSLYARHFCTERPQLFHRLLTVSGIAAALPVLGFLLMVFVL